MSEAGRRIVRLAFEELGCDPDNDELGALSEFAVRAGLLEPRARATETRTTKDAQATRKIRNWLHGTDDPKFEFLMRMLHAAGLLHPAVEAAWLDVDQKPPPALEAPAATPGVGEARSRRRAG